MLIAMVGILCVNNIVHENQVIILPWLVFFVLIILFLNIQVIIFAISWFPINLINLLADCIELGGAFTFSKSS